MADIVSLIAPNGATVTVAAEKAQARIGAGYKPVKEGGASGAPDKSWKVADLTAHAEENGIDLGGATKKEDILAAIAAAAPATGNDGSDES